MVTIYDVAARAGVSPATVSRVFNGIKVSPNRVEAVRKAADDLGFVPNRNARRLRTSSSEIIAMLIPDIENPFFTIMTRAVEDVARAGGYSVMLCNTDENPERELDYLRAAVSDPVAGIIVAPSSRNTRLDLAIDRGVPVVCIDRRAPRYPVDSVVADNLAGAREAAQMLLDAGYKRMACVSGPEGVETADDRAAGWAETYRRATGSEPPDELIIRTSYTLAGGERAAEKLLALPEPPDAIFAANNKLASGVIRALATAGRLPPEVGVVSFGGLPLVLLVPLGVLEAHLPVREIGITAATMLLERIQGLDVPPRDVVVPVVLTQEEAGISLLEGAGGYGR
ncbi:MAG: LacI family DNA-binding transcriptional regulator [Propionicimonas sp.]